MSTATRSVTMKDVAKAVGLSSAAVSMALREHCSIPHGTRERVRRVAQDLGYHKNPMLMALSQQRSRDRVTMQDIANFTGVHQTTVSIALRNHPSIPESTRLKIQQAAVELGYTKDPGIEAFNRYRLECGSKATA